MIGFLSQRAIPSPPSLARHVVSLFFYFSLSFYLVFSLDKQIVPLDPHPNVAGLLHESLKAEKLTAVVELAPNWFGCVNTIVEKERSGSLRVLLCSIMLTFRSACANCPCAEPLTVWTRSSLCSGTRPCHECDFDSIRGVVCVVATTIANLVLQSFRS